MSGRWAYTSVTYEYDKKDRVVGYSGSIHAGWEDAPVFTTQDEYYDWAKRECATRDLLEAAAPDLLAALKLAHHFASLWADEFGSEDARTARDAAEAALSKAQPTP